mmetsp:Transcript_14363/g.39933  ORF Transcript_14363/g.39933 Transcript_14363/m.39933 type:complete len:380 (-) Transcript_14363:1313-2452(-)
MLRWVSLLLFILRNTSAFSPRNANKHASISPLIASRVLSLRSSVPAENAIGQNGATESATDSPLFSSTMASVGSDATTPAPALGAWQSRFTRIGMIAYIAAMCIALPLTLLPQKLMYNFGFLIKTRAQKEDWALRTSTFCARWLLRLIPFCRITTFSSMHPNPPESVWVCNHTSMLDVFLLLAADLQARGKTRRPIKIVYWKQLEDNPVTALMFRQAGFIPVQMADNGNGQDNDYDRSSFKQLIKDARQAFGDGFDIGILPEGQLNPTPENGLLPVFSGAFTLARMSRRPVQMLAMAGAHDLWHPVHGMHCVRRHVQIRVYPYTFRFQSADNFVKAFTDVVGNFATHKTDLPEAEMAELVANNMLQAAPTRKSKSDSDP